MRGTRWLVEDSCTTTTTKVEVGSVTVEDKVKKLKKVIRRRQALRRQGEEVVRRLAIAVFGALAFSAAPAHAATFQVNTTADSTVCNAVTCSLQGAFLGRASTTDCPMVDVINVPSGTYAVLELITTPGSTGVLRSSAPAPMRRSSSLPGRRACSS